jgi:hypothetical protein
MSEQAGSDGQGPRLSLQLFESVALDRESARGSLHRIFEHRSERADETRSADRDSSRSLFTLGDRERPSVVG